MSIKKQYLKSKAICKVTFTIDNGETLNVETAFLAGDFNNWDNKSIPMKKSKGGESFSATVSLESGREYQFRYILGESKWLNDKEADKYYATNYHDAENSVVVV